LLDDHGAEAERISLWDLSETASEPTSRCGRIDDVPAISSRFLGIVIALYFDDRGPP
jgi:hypothetical protein